MLKITFGIKRHKPKTRGVDGRLGNDFIEAVTITSEKKSKKAGVKRQGNFKKLLVVNINEDFELEARMLDRKTCPKVQENWQLFPGHP